MKRLLLTFFGMFLMAHQLLAIHAGATFTTKRGEAFRLFLDGHPVNHHPSNQVRLTDVISGNHNVEFRMPGYRSSFHSRIFLEPGHETNFEVAINRHGGFVLRKMSVFPIYQPLPPVAACPPPAHHAPQPHGNLPDSYYNYNNSYNSGGYAPDYGAGNCRNLFSSYDVNGLLQSMQNKSFESSKLAIAQQAVSGGSILADDVKRIMQAFTFETTRVDFAKFAYAYTCDTQNYYRVYDAFQYESSIGDLERYLRGR